MEELPDKKQGSRNSEKMSTISNKWISSEIVLPGKAKPSIDYHRVFLGTGGLVTQSKCILKV
jgi:hypothetical protein